MFENVNTMTSDQFAAEYRTATKLAAEVSLDVTAFLRRILEPGVFASVESRMGLETASRMEKLERARQVVRDFYRVESGLQGRDWLLAFHRTDKQLLELGVGVCLEGAAEIIDGVDPDVWIAKEGKEWDVYNKGLKAEFGFVWVWDLRDLDASDIGESWRGYYAAMKPGQQTTIHFRIGNYIVESGAPIPEDRLREIIEIMG